MQVLGVCGGNGVILHPFKNQLIGNIEPRSLFKTPGNIQWDLNFMGIPLYNKIPEKPISPEVIVGAPDCGHSSILSYSRAKHLSDPKDNMSLNMFWEAIRRYLPKVFLMENLPAMFQQLPLSLIEEAFPEYKFIAHETSVKSFGNSQINRVRLILIGIRKDTNIPKKTFSLGREPKGLKYSGELIQGLLQEDEGLCNIREDINSTITMYSQCKLSLIEIKNRWRLEFQNSKRWVVHNRKFSTAPGVYKNLKNDYPATARKTNRQFNHYGLMMSPRELARIQGVPDSFKIYYDNTRRQFCINKGRTTVTKTPPYEVGEWFLKCLTKIL